MYLPGPGKCFDRSLCTSCGGRRCSYVWVAFCLAGAPMAVSSLGGHSPPYRCLNPKYKL